MFQLDIPQVAVFIRIDNHDLMTRCSLDEWMQQSPQPDWVVRLATPFNKAHLLAVAMRHLVDIGFQLNSSWTFAKTLYQLEALSAVTTIDELRQAITKAMEKWINGEMEESPFSRVFDQYYPRGEQSMVTERISHCTRMVYGLLSETRNCTQSNSMCQHSMES